MTVGAGPHYSKLPTLPAGTFRYEIREKLNEYNGTAARLLRATAGGPAPGRGLATPRPPVATIHTAGAAPLPASPQLVLAPFFLLVSFSKNLSGMAQSTKQANILQQSPPEAFQAKATVSVKSKNQIVGGRVEPEVELLLLLAVAVGPHVGVEQRHGCGRMLLCSAPWARRRCGSEVDEVGEENEVRGHGVILHERQEGERVGGGGRRRGGGRQHGRRSGGGCTG
ncbi:hypothetical protein PVAP13_4NG237071 [Panicum virgatum]|uniref:Uncharacterized protein n=1 Tax=Panicum virgatum TaxID=38727 RepID=A0A8T0T9P6_PANVG|nr:hypothetical protein PVAP13_4NG237071 [Panicum virgatum]